MRKKRFALLAPILIGLALGALSLTLLTLSSVRAEVTDANVTIVKEGDPMVISGETANFTITVNNISTTTLNSVSVSDTLVPQCSHVIGTMDVGDSETYYCTSDPVRADLNNVVTVTAVISGGGTASDTDTAFVDVVTPAVEIAKGPDTQMVLYDGIATFSITISNTGDVALTNVTVADAAALYCNYGPISLNPNERVDYSCEAQHVTTDFTNSALVVGTSPLGNVVSDTDTASVNVIAPAIEIAKTPNVQTVDSGDPASFTIAVTNTGDVILTGVTVVDPLIRTCEFYVASLLPDVSADHTCGVPTVNDGFINNAIVTGMTPASGPVSDADAAHVILSSAQACPAGMSAYWKLDETSGSAFDDFYSGHDGVCADQCPTPTTGRVNGGQAFDGSDTGIDVPAFRGDDSFNWGADDSFSIELWMKNDPLGPGSTQVIIGRDDGPASRLHWWVGRWNSGEAAFILIDRQGYGDEPEQYLHGTTNLADDEDWHHIVAVRDADTEQIRLYVDGVQEASAPAEDYVSFASQTAALNIGWLNLEQGYHFVGSVDEVAIHRRALSASEIEHHYYEGLWLYRGYCEDSEFVPAIYSTPVITAAVQMPYSYDVDAIGNPVPTYALTINPDGMTIDPDTGLISWQPLMSQRGSHPMQVMAGNSQGTDPQDFTIEVAEGPFCPADMISYWKLDETGGTTYADYYNGNAATCPGTGQCPTWTTGRVNGGQTFDGNDRIDVAADASFDWGADESFSIEFWMSRPGSLTGNEVIVGRQGPTHPEPHLWAGAAYGEWVSYRDVAAFCLYEASDTGACVTGDTVVSGGGWHHIVAVHDADARELRIYVDGAEDGSIGEPGYPDYTAGFSTTTALNIGWLNFLGGYYYNGTLDEVSLYNRALSETEIQQHHDRGVAGRGYCFYPLIALEKAANPAVVYADDEVTYNYTLINPGDDPLSKVDVSDDMCSPVTFVEGDDNSDDALDPEETWTYACSINASVDITNTATATGTDTLGGTVNDTSTAFVNVINPDIDIAKTADRTIIYPGQAITYTYTVTNTGDDPLSKVGVSDDMCSPVTLASGDEDWDRVLDLDETWTYTCSAILSADTLNTAVVTSTDSAGNIVSATVTTFVNVINLEIDIAKTADPMTVYAGDTVTYTYTVTNPKDDPLSDISVSDDHCNPGGLQSGDTNGDNELDPGETWIYGCSTTLDQDTTNTATVEGINLLGDPVSDTAIASVNVINPEIDITIAAHPDRVQTGEWVTYTYTVANPGDDPLSNVTVRDDQCATVAFVEGDANLDGVLDLAESWIYRCSKAMLESTTSTAIVESIDSLGNAVSDTAMTTVYVGRFVYLPIILNSR